MAIKASGNAVTDAIDTVRRMRATQRYICVLVVCTTSLLILHSLLRHLLPSPGYYSSPLSIENDYDSLHTRRSNYPGRHGDNHRDNDTFDDCRMSTCFDYTRCPSFDRFKVFVYPVDRTENISPIYAEILKVFYMCIYVIHTLFH